MMKKALVLEDIAATRCWLSSNLVHAFPGVEIDEAATLQQSITLAQNRLYDIALVDLSLPDGSGTDLIRALQAKNNQTLCVVTTIHDDDNHLFSSLKAGAKGYLLKDCSEERFIASLQGIARGELPLSPVMANRLIEHFSSEAPGMVHLTPREREVLILIAKGISSPAIAQMLNLSYHTVNGYVKEIYRKLDVSSRAEVSIKAMNMGLL